MILVDTSVWVAYFRGADSRLVDRLRALLEENQVALALPVRLEILSGAATKELIQLHHVLAALPLLVPSNATWHRVESWIEKAVSKGERFGVADLLVAALAADRDMPLWSLDRDFERMQKLGFIWLYLPFSS